MKVVGWILFKTKTIQTAGETETIKNCAFRESEKEQDRLKCKLKVQEFHYFSSREQSGENQERITLSLDESCTKDDGYPSKLWKVITPEMSLLSNMQSPEFISTDLDSLDLACDPISPDAPTAYYHPAKLSSLSRSVRDTEFFAPEPLRCAIEHKSDIPSMTVGGDFCRLDSPCGMHGKDYNWCYIDWQDNWDYCCEDQCDFHDKDYTWCQI